MVDTSIYKNSWFRLPYQTAKEKPHYHEIIQRKPEDFLVQIILEDTQIFNYKIYEITSKEMNKKMISSKLKLQRLIIMTIKKILIKSFNY
jgi:hypothetical protein